MKTRKLEEILVERGLVREPDIARLLDSERARGQPLGTLLVQQGLISEEDGARFNDDFEVRFISEQGMSGELDSSGAEGLGAMWREWLTPFKSYLLDVDEIIDA